MHKTGIALAALFLASCAAQTAQSSPAGGMVRISNFATGDREAVAQAQAECARYGKTAKVTNSNMWTDSLYYDCVQ
jgi:hypothetical protein